MPETRHIKTVSSGISLRRLETSGCHECQTSCQSACKTSCTVGNQACRQ
ncbi:MAG TPA: six-cysteine peptide SCIFF [Firmicutes bacterium]|nr:six-cysteine peptide SCIFF [Bacillota bacterium]